MSHNTDFMQMSYDPINSGYSQVLLSIVLGNDQQSLPHNRTHKTAPLVNSYAQSVRVPITWDVLIIRNQMTINEKTGRGVKGDSIEISRSVPNKYRANLILH